MILHGDCLDRMQEMGADSVDAIVTDPPYGLAFMGKRWDYDVPSVEVWAEALRVLKPGGRLLCFAGTRTMHRMWVNIEDAGFIIEDTICWLYGSGFPKHRSKLKPAHEPICVARKGFVSPLNVDGCRIGTDVITTKMPGRTGGTWEGNCGLTARGRSEHAGRWPANVLLDEEAGEQMGPEARYFYCAKPRRKERGEGNRHPTVKPVSLMQYLVRLVTPPGGLVLDPFAGSGTTGVACVREGMRFVGIEREAEYCEIARRRIEAEPPVLPMEAA